MCSCFPTASRRWTGERLAWIDRWTGWCHCAPPCAYHCTRAPETIACTLPPGGNCGRGRRYRVSEGLSGVPTGDGWPNARAASPVDEDAPRRAHFQTCIHGPFLISILLWVV